MKSFLKNHGFLVLFFVLGIFFRFYNLNWGAPFYFHPDERQNIVYPVLESHSPFMLDQHNFDTGTFPLMVLKIVLTLSTTFHLDTLFDPFFLVLLLSRYISAIISVAILLLLFFIVKKIFGTTKSYLTFIFASLSVGFIQFSHFGTIELWEAFFFLLLFYYSWKIAKYAHITDGMTCGILIGIATATKILSIILIPGIFCSALLFLYHQHSTKQNLLQSIRKLVLLLFLFSVSAGISFLLTSPQIITNFQAFYSSIHFESTVALGKLPVFYTGGFYQTTPLIFQFTKVYPFLVNPLMTVLFIPSFFSVVFVGMKKRNYSYLLLAAYYLLLFMTQAFFFVKWTRYMIPTLPFFYMIIAIAVSDWLSLAKKRFEHADLFSYLLITTPSVISFLFAAAFWITVYVHPTTPVTAALFAKEHISSNSPLLSEPFDLGIMPFNQYFSSITQFNFYDLDDPHTKTSTRQQLATELATHETIILPSQRIFKTRLTNSKNFPKGHTFYTKLFSGQLGFEKIYETPCDLFCKITYANNPIFSYEETANVFDRPTLVIFKKVKPLDEKTYQAMLQ